MVSFSCESCGDVLTKKKLDSHRGHCRNASFTCLDCMTHFRANDYKAHTSCISEAQKYQGHLYQEKPSKAKKSVTFPRKAYVEDAPDADLDNNTVAIVNAPPHAPSPPRAVPVGPVNVFDFLVNEDTPNASKVSLGGSKEQMRMVEHAQPLFKSRTQSPNGSEDERETRTYDDKFRESGFSYGAEPISTVDHNVYRTPAPKIRMIEPRDPRDSRESIYEMDGRDRRSTDKKRKRQIEELDLTQARRSSQEIDEDMPDAGTVGPPILHSGLTGGLNRLLSKSKFPPSPDYSGGDNYEPSPLSPVKRKKDISDKSRGRTSALVKVRKVRRTSDESRPRKHHRSQRHAHDEHADRPKRSLKAIEYPGHGREEDSQQQLVVYRTRAELFLSFVNKGPESEHGCSVNKALKRYHRERSEQGLGLGKVEEEKELWKTLRLRKNERGEIVLLA